MTTRNLQYLFRPGSVAVIGASNQPGSMGETVMRNLLEARFAGPIMPVNPRYKAVGGVLAYPDVASLPECPDLAIIATPPATVPELVRELGARGTRAAVVLSSGLDRERGADGRLRLQAMLDAARPYLLRILGPNSVGLMVPEIGLNASYVHTGPLSGRLAFVTESGGLATAVLDYAASSGIGFSHFISVGQGADVDVADVLDYLGAESEIAAILLYMEAPPAARKFLSAARAAARGRPVLVVKAGRAAERPRHEGLCCGALAHPDAVFDAVVRRSGMLRVGSIPALFDAVETLARTRPLAGDRLTIVSNGKSPAVIAVDALADGNGRLARLSEPTLDRLAEVLPDTWQRGNPVDVEEDASPDRQVATLEILFDDPETDAVLFIHEPVAVVDSEELARGLVDTVVTSGRAVFACWLGRRSVEGARRVFAEAGIATYDSPEQAVSAFLCMVQYRRSQQMLIQTPESAPDSFIPDAGRVRTVIAAALREGRERLAGPEAKAVLAAYGVPVGDAAVAMVEPGRHSRAHELFVGATTDRAFGPVLVFAHGGPAVEVIQDFTVALPPLNVVLAAAVVARTRVARRLAGEAGGPGVDLEAIHLALVKIAQLIADHPEIVELDVNPLVADPDGVTALDARLRIAPASTTGAERLAIRPYPKDLEEDISFQGRPVRLRPIRPEDAPQHRTFFDRLSPEDVRYRFFSMLRQLAQSELARFTQIDYDREMAFIATARNAAGEPETLGVVRAVTDPARGRAEFAIAVRSDLKGRGLGHSLLAKMMRYCESCGIGELVSEALEDNRSMRSLARRLGFTEAPSEEGDTVILHRRLPPPADTKP